MRPKKFLLVLTLLFIACDKSDEEPTAADYPSIIGKWQLTEAYISSGGLQYWTDVENGEEIDFFENKIFSSNRFAECTTGHFSITKNELCLEYDCSGFNPISENEKGYISYSIEFYKGYLILTPTSGPVCIEGCSYKYENKG